MKRLAALAMATLTLPAAASAHSADLPHVHPDDPTLLMGLAAIAILAVIAIIVKRNT
ncbi:hypothetical protein [Marinibacterium sp. SX1]|uniref:hypothetical protein n=1 Tax=Marinibacterium sp. SX1 TaxID=3388424 RepID=UPI003D16735D